MTADQLMERYSDKATRNKLFDLLDLRELLALCLIRGDYRISTKLYEPLVPSDAGQRLIDQLKRKGVPYPEARAFCLLEVLHTDLLLDIEKTRVDSFVHEISEEIRQAKLRYPYTYGRDLYDRSVNLDLREDRLTLTRAQTDDMLDGLPQGVFQVGRFVTGPYGLLESRSSRFVPPDLRAPFHCADPGCRTIHHRYFITSDDAPINDHRPKVTKQLERDSAEGSEWKEFFRRCTRPQESSYNDLAGDPIVYLLGDALTLEEIRKVLTHLLDSTKGQLRSIAQQYSLRGDAASIASKLNFAEALQLLLTADNRQIFHAVDILTSRGIIEIPEGEIRTPVLSGKAGFGKYRLEPELGQFGVRLQSRSTDLAPLRLRRLIGEMYDLNNLDERKELHWQLRSQESDSLEAGLEQYLQSREPREAVSSLLLARRKNMDTSLEKLHLSEETLDTDADRINAVLWKLGFSVEDSLDRHKNFWQMHAKMGQLTRQSPISPRASDQEQIRGQAASYFVQLEDVVRDSLLYTVWALTQGPGKVVVR